MPSTKIVRARSAGMCSAEFAHPAQIEPGHLTEVSTHYPGDELVSFFGVPAFTRTRRCQWCVVEDAIRAASRDEYGLLRLRDRQGDLWQFGPDRLMHSRETAPFPFEHVQRKWGPLRFADWEGTADTCQ